MDKGYRLNLRARIFARKSNKAIKKVSDGFGQEYEETKDMAKLFYKLLAQKLNLDDREDMPTEEEVKRAIDQLKDVGRISVFTSISLIPGGGFSLIGLELLARKFGIKNFTFIPSAFRKKEENVESSNDKLKKY